MPKIKEIISSLEKLAPPHLAEPWDHIGLMVGDPQGETDKVLCALDVNEAVIDEAISLQAGLIVSHHPFLFKPLSNLDLSSERGKMIKKLVQHDIAVYAMHTNYDIAFGGLNDYLAEGLGLQDIKVLSPTKQESYYKVIVYVPSAHVDVVREAVIAEGAGQIGDYKGCTFAAAGEGTFIPLEGSQPFIGEKDTLSKVEEKALSFMVLESELARVIKAVKKVHPYEEMAYDVFKLENIQKQYGLGRFGKLDKPIKLGDFLSQVKQYFHIPYVRVSTEDLEQMIERVALCSGEGSEFMEKASKVADVYITGDAKFHQAQMAQSMELILIDVGHYASENRALEPIGKAICAALPQCEVIYSAVNGETLFIK